LIDLYSSLISPAMNHQKFNHLQDLLKAKITLPQAKASANFCMTKVTKDKK